MKRKKHFLRLITALKARNSVKSAIIYKNSMTQPCFIFVWLMTSPVQLKTVTFHNVLISGVEIDNSS